MSEFHQAHHRGPLTDSSSSNIRTTARWVPPPHGAYKIKCCAAVPLNINKIGIGAIIRDSESFVMAALTKSIHGKYPPKVAEAMALSTSLSCVTTQNWGK